MKILLLAALLVPTLSWAQPAKPVPVGTNLKEAYPAEPCRKPYKPSNFKSKSETEDFDNDVAEYLECVQGYVNRANADILLIQQKATKAVQRAKAQY